MLNLSVFLQFIFFTYIFYSIFRVMRTWFICHTINMKQVFSLFCKLKTYATFTLMPITVEKSLAFGLMDSFLVSPSILPVDYRTAAMLRAAAQHNLGQTTWDYRLLWCCCSALAMPRDAAYHRQMAWELTGLSWSVVPTIPGNIKGRKTHQISGSQFTTILIRQVKKSQLGMWCASM